MNLFTGVFLVIPNMDSTTYLFTYVPAYLLAIIIAQYLHEGSHWVVGKLGGTNPTVTWKSRRCPWPLGVRHDEIETMDARTIRFSGLSIFLWFLPMLLSFGLLIEEFTPWRLFAFIVPYWVLFGIASKSDALAVRDPEEYRESSLTDGFPRDPLFNQKIVYGVLFVFVVYPALFL